jgi:hypothetical protein
LWLIWSPIAELWAMLLCSGKTIFWNLIRADGRMPGCRLGNYCHPRPFYI